MTYVADIQVIYEAGSEDQVEQNVVHFPNSKTIESKDANVVLQQMHLLNEVVVNQAPSDANDVYDEET